MERALLLATLRGAAETLFILCAAAMLAWTIAIETLRRRLAAFPRSRGGLRLVRVASGALLALSAASVALVAASPSASAKRVGRNGGSRALRLSANPAGALAFDTTKLTAQAGTVTLEFTNNSPLPHNVTIATSGGSVRGRTATFIGGTRRLRIRLAPGRYTFYCSVAGHEAAGMKGTITVR